MRNLWPAIALVVALFALIYVIHTFQPWSSLTSNNFARCNTTVCDEKLKQAAERLRKISLSANSIQEKYQQLVCKMDEKKYSTSSTGGWCSNAFATGHVTDGHFARALETVFAKKRVIGLGDGPGAYRKHMLAKGVVQQFDSYDGSPFISNNTNSQVNFLDLTLQQYWLPVYDWVLCVEVLEHIPSTYEDVALDNIDRAAGEGVVLSWAVPGQGGFQHINNRSPEYVIKAMADRGFKLDANMTSFLRANSHAAWIRNNVKVFRRATSGSY